MAKEQQVMKEPGSLMKEYQLVKHELDVARDEILSYQNINEELNNKNQSLSKDLTDAENKIIAWQRQMKAMDTARSCVITLSPTGNKVKLDGLWRPADLHQSFRELSIAIRSQKREKPKELETLPV